MQEVDTQTVFLIIASTTVVMVLASALSIYLGRRTASSEDWAVGGHDLPTYVVVGTQYATAMGGGILVGLVGIGYSSGWSVITYGLWPVVGILTFTFLAPWLRQQNFATLPDVFAKLYGPKPFLLALVSLACIVVPFGWVATQLVAFGKLFSGLTGLPMPVLMIAMAVVGLILVMPAGLTSVAWTDFIFGCLMLAMSMASLVFAFDLASGWSGVRDNVPPEIVAFPDALGAAGNGTILLWALAILPGTLTNQMYYQRIYAIRNVRKARVSLVASAIVIFSSILWAALVGLAIRAAQPGLEPELAAGWFLAQLPPWFLALYAGFIAATIVSTIDSAVQSATVNLTRDVYQKLIRPEASDKQLLNLSRVLAVVVTALATTWAIAWPEALGWLVATYAYSASGLLFPLFVGYACRHTEWLTPQGAIGGVLSGFAGSAAAHAAGTEIPYVAFGLTSSLVGLLVVSFATRTQPSTRKTSA